MVIDLQKKGGKHDSATKLHLENLAECHLYFERVKAIFYNINSWSDLFPNGINFQLTDKNGVDKFTNIVVGDLVKIKLPVLKNRSGDGYDWVQIVDLETKIDSTSTQITMVLSPAQNPVNPGCIAHFFRPESKNYLIIRKEDCEITAEAHGRNELSNFENLNFKNRTRNYLVSKISAFGFGKIEWKFWSSNILSNQMLCKSGDI